MGNRNAWIHGNRSAEAEEQLKTVRATDRNLKVLKKVQQGHRLRTRGLDRLLAILLEYGHLPNLNSQ